MAWAETAGALGPKIDAIENGADDKGDDFGEQYYISLSLVERIKLKTSKEARVKLAERIFDYAVVIKQDFPEVGSLMIERLASVDPAARRDANAAWKRAARAGYAEILA